MHTVTKKDKKAFLAFCAEEVGRYDLKKPISERKQAISTDGRALCVWTDGAKLFDDLSKNAPSAILALIQRYWEATDKKVATALEPEAVDAILGSYIQGNIINQLYLNNVLKFDETWLAEHYVRVVLGLPLGKFVHDENASRTKGTPVLFVWKHGYGVVMPFEHEKQATDFKFVGD